jgi:type VI secretion system secreted protein VgrG
MTQSGIKSRSSKGGSPANFNEIRFEDKKGEEQVYIHAEKNQDNVVENDATSNVGHDETTNVGHDRTETVGHDETIHIKNNRTENVGGHGQLSSRTSDENRARLKAHRVGRRRSASGRGR